MMDRTFLEGLLEDGAVIDTILQEHESTVKRMEFQHSLQQAVTAAGGRNLTAIRALLDEEELFGSENQEQAMSDALKKLKRESPYLFESRMEQPYSAGKPAQLGYSMEDLGAMSMSQYKRFRKGN